MSNKGEFGFNYKLHQQHNNTKNNSNEMDSLYVIRLWVIIDIWII